MVQTKLYTADDLWELSRDGKRRELVNGVIVEMSPAGDEHGVLSLEIGSLIRNHVRANSLPGYPVGAESGFFLKRNPDLVRAPDAAYISKAKVPGGLTGKYYTASPDLAVAVVSPDDAASEVHNKVREHLDAGTELVWLLYADSRTVSVNTATGARTLTENDVLDGGSVLPGFSISVRKLFACLDG